MQLIDYTHPSWVPDLHLEHDRRSAQYYLRLDELPADHPYYYPDWVVFRHDDWLEAGSAWVQARAIVQDLERYCLERGLGDEVRPVVGSANYGFDEALAQGLKTFGYRPMVAEVNPVPDPDAPGLPVGALSGADR